ncbi:hypothetical protein [Methylobacterium sp. 37f]|uniref:hypothetical protein n=1 Tax=Methylobacterium sp. 37f TaxID=2817058 RepID=UPI001FFD4E82|nr:hypothetical protein [Methylobacterium sp. 37f]MCK2057165.1 hypothetical protein [Methylobacterium sp. 37f]
MSNAQQKRASLFVIDVAIRDLRARREHGDLRGEIEVSGLSVLNLANRAYSLGVYKPEEARMLSQLVLRLADVLPANPDDRKEVRA